MESTHLGPRRRRRLKYHRAKHDLLVMIICSLNFEVLGFPVTPPPCARVGAPLTDAQAEVLERLEVQIDHFLHMEPWVADDLGRAQSRFEMIIKSIEELPKCSFGLEDLTEFLVNLHASLDPYSQHFARESAVKAQFPDPATHFCTAGSTAVTESQVAALPVTASRIKWENPPSFAARDFLDDPLLKAAFDDPETLRKPEALWERVPPGKMHCSREEFLKLALRWDELGACCIIPKSSKDMSETAGIFCVPKDSKHDRLIINPRTINSRMYNIARSTKDLAPGCLLGLLHLEPDEYFRFNADDLTDFYYTFIVSQKRAARNAFKFVFQGKQLSHFRCYRPELANHEVLLCLKTLAMGDNLAVEVAQQAHCNVLRSLCGGMVPEETLRYRHPVPRSDFVELLAIDDHIGLQKVPIRDFPKKPKLRDTEVFTASEVAYKKVGLVQHEKKRKRNETSGVLLGADFDGKAGRVMAPRNRVAVLCLITFAVARVGTCTSKMLSILTGCWIHVLLFRRAMFSIMNHIFREGQGRPAHEPFCLSRESRSELQLLASVGCLAQSDLRSKYVDRIFSTDASPVGGSVIYAPISTNMTQELWRHSEQRGFYTRLLNPAAEILHEKGFQTSIDLDQPYNSPEISASSPFPPLGVPAPLSEGILYDCVEIFKGSGGWSEAHAALGFKVHDGFDIDSRRIRISDLDQPSTCHELIALAWRRVVRAWHAGVPCLTYGTLRRPQLRSKKAPAGFDPNEPVTAYHNRLARRTAFVLTIAMSLGQYISVEQPGNSRLFLLHCFRQLVLMGCVISHFCFCSYGSAFNKHSKWLHNLPWLIPLETRCDCPFKNNHFVIEGSFTHDTIQEFDRRCRPSAVAVYGRMPQAGESVASFSAAYPYKLVTQMASGMMSAVRGRRQSMPRAAWLRSLKEIDETEPTVKHDFLPGDLYPERPWHEGPEWISEICNSLKFRELFRYTFHRSGHINVNESRVYKSWIKAMAKSHPNSRFVGLLDSRVTIGATAKGRSSSYAISRVLQGCLAYILGSNLYPGCLHCSSADNRSDGPSRGRPIEPPSRDVPPWLQDLIDGSSEKFDKVVMASRVSKNPARWIRFLLLLCGDIHPHPGPKMPRGPMDLSVGFVEQTSSRMRKCVDAFNRWCDEELKIQFQKLVHDSQALAWALRAYGLYCFESGLPRYLFVYTLTGMQEFYPSLRAHLGLAWQIDKKWQIHEPGQCRSVLPALVIRAALCLAGLWGWYNWLGIVALGFAAMLHPSEMLALTRRDLVFPRDLAEDSTGMFIHVANPKTARFARRQHGRVDDPDIVWLVEQIFGHLPLQQRLYPLSASSFRKQWNAVMSRLGISHRQADKGATPGVLRGSGATFLYSCSEDINWVAWRGRWSRVRTLEYYLQEVGAQLLVHSLDPLSKKTITELSKFSWPVLRSIFLTG